PNLYKRSYLEKAQRSHSILISEISKRACAISLGKFIYHGNDKDKQIRYKFYIEKKIYLEHLRKDPLKNNSFELLGPKKRTSQIVALNNLKSKQKVEYVLFILQNFRKDFIPTSERERERDREHLKALHRIC
uniref:Uncharacterized protein n=1 Tax=Callorhinchus milii TaxID=7868 RepID=A0A4W3K1B1_CALMI